jgi:Cys-tRNA(Pro) deacylase
MVPKRVSEVLEAHGLEAKVFEEGTTPTAPMAAEALGVQVGQIAKSLLFRGKDDGFYLVVCPGDRKVSTGKLKRAVGAKTRMANAEETFEVTGYEPGGVCPFAVDGVEILLDEALREWDTVYPAAGTSGSGVPVTPSQLEAITGGRVVELTNPIQ